MADDILALENAILETKSKKMAEVAKIDYDTLRAKAISFVTKIRSKQEGFLHGSNFKQMYSAFALELGKADNKDFMRECFVEAEKLEQAVNDFLGREILFTYVNPEGEILFYDDQILLDMYGRLGSSGVLKRKATREEYGNAKGKIPVKRADAVQKFEDRFLEEMRLRVQEAVGKKAIVYQEALARHDDQNKNYKKEHEDMKLTFYWWVSKKKLHWYEGTAHPAKSYNKGRIAEAYVENIINNKYGFNTRLTNLETSLKYLFYSIDLDNVPAILKGDVQVDDFGNLHLQIKSGSASTAAIGQYIALAYYIIDQGDQDLTPEKMEAVLKKSQDLNHSAAQDIFVDLFNYSSQNVFNENWSGLHNNIIAQISV